MSRYSKELKMTQNACAELIKNRNSLLAALCGFAGGIVVHFFKLANYLVNHDSLSTYGSDVSWLIPQGKWFAKALSGFDGAFNVSCLSMMMGIAFAALSAGVFCAVLYKKSWYCRMLHGIISSFRQFAG